MKKWASEPLIIRDQAVTPARQSPHSKPIGIASKRPLSPRGGDKAVASKGEDDELARVIELSHQDAQRIPSGDATLAHALEISRVEAGVERQMRCKSEDSENAARLLWAARRDASSLEQNSASDAPDRNFETGTAGGLQADI